MTEDDEIIYVAEVDGALVVYLTEESEGVVLDKKDFVCMPDVNYLQ